MFQLFAFVLMVSTIVSISAPVLADTLNGEISNEAAAAQENAQSLEANSPTSDDSLSMRGLRIYVHQGQIPRVKLNEFIALMKQRALEGNGIDGIPLQGSATQQRSAIGVWFAYPSGIVEGIDPASDLSGKVVPGDRILAINGVSPLESALTGANFGNAGTIAQVTYSHDGTVQTLPCKRQPISFFQPQAQSMLNSGAHPIKTE